MKTSFTPEYIYENKGCYSTEQVDSLSFIKQNEITIDTILNSEISLQYKIWYAFNNCEMTLKEKQLLGLQFAKVSLVNYESLYPNDNRVRNAIDAAEICIENPTDENESAARSAWSAANSAWSAANSAAWSANSAARSAAESARSARSAANSAANSAAWSAESAAESAAWSAAWSAEKTKVQEQQLLTLLINYIK